MNLAFWMALLIGTLAFLMGLIRKVSILVLIERSILSSIVIYILVSLLEFGLKRAENNHHPFQTLTSNDQEKSELNQKASSDNPAEESSKPEHSQISHDLISRLGQDPVRGAQLIRKMSLEEETK